MIVHTIFFCLSDCLFVYRSLSVFVSFSFCFTTLVSVCLSVCVFVSVPLSTVLLKVTIRGSRRVHASPSYQIVSDVLDGLQNGCVTRQVCWWASGCLSPCAFSLHRWLAMLLAAPRKGEQSANLSLPVHSPSTAGPMQYLLVAAGVYGCRKAPEPTCKGEIRMAQR